MRKVFLTVTVLVGISVTYLACFNNISSAQARLKQQFAIDVGNKDYKVINEKEEWGVNGDGFYYAEIKFNKDITKVLLEKGFRGLPITEELPEMSIDLEQVNNGYYKFNQEESDDRNFKIAIYDLDRRRILFYYQIM